MWVCVCGACVSPCLSLSLARSLSLSLPGCMRPHRWPSSSDRGPPSRSIGQHRTQPPGEQRSPGAAPATGHESGHSVAQVVSLGWSPLVAPGPCGATALLDVLGRPRQSRQRPHFRLPRLHQVDPPGVSGTRGVAIHRHPSLMVPLPGPVCPPVFVIAPMLGPSFPIFTETGATSGQSPAGAAQTYLRVFITLVPSQSD